MNEIYIPDDTSASVYTGRSHRTLEAGFDAEQRRLSIPDEITVALNERTFLKMGGRIARMIGEALVAATVPTTEMFPRGFHAIFNGVPGNGPYPVSIINDADDVIPWRPILGGYALDGMLPVLVGVDRIAYEFDAEAEGGPTLFFRGTLPDQTIEKFLHAKPGRPFKVMAAISATKLTEEQVADALALGPFRSEIAGDW